MPGAGRCRRDVSNPSGGEAQRASLARTQANAPSRPYPGRVGSCHTRHDQRRAAAICPTSHVPEEGDRRASLVVTANTFRAATSKPAPAQRVQCMLFIVACRTSMSAAENRTRRPDYDYATVALSSWQGRDSRDGRHLAEGRRGTGCGPRRVSHRGNIVTVFRSTLFGGKFKHVSPARLKPTRRRCDGGPGCPVHTMPHM